MERRTIQFTAEGFRSQEIEIAPDIPMQSLSKRYAVIKEEVSDHFCILNILKHKFKPFKSF
jgi:hypothetical protein